MVGMGHRGTPPADARRESKPCASCGREMHWRARWAANWDDVKYCSDACRRRRVSTTDRELERSILSLLAQRDRSASICPSEAARAVGGDGWRDLMEPARRAARRLVVAGEVDILQRGAIVDPSTARGPIRIRRR
jgi:hypothetical protein